MKVHFTKTLASVFACVIAALAIPLAPLTPILDAVSFTADADSSDSYFTFNPETRTITGYYSSTPVPVIIPSTIDGVPVEVIGEYAFDYKDYVETVTIPDTVTTIEKKAFEGCTNLTSISIPNSVTSIGTSVFSGCKSLTSITLPDSVTTISAWMFYECNSLTEVNFPDTIESIGEFAFTNCTALETLTLPNSLKTIGQYAFDNCSSLVDVFLPDSITTIDAYAFIDCSALESITLPGSLTTISNSLFLFCSSLKDITIPDSVTSIEASAFQGCSSLTNLVIPVSVTSIGSGVWNNCKRFDTIYYTGTEEQWYDIKFGENNILVLTYDKVFNYKYEPRVALALDGSLKVLFLFADDITDGWTVNGKKFTTTHKIASYDVAAKDFMKDIVLAKNGQPVATFKVEDILTKYKDKASTSSIAKALEAYCQAAAAYFDDTATVEDFSSSWEHIELATKSSNLSDKMAALGDNYYGTSLLLRSSTILRHYFTDEDSELSYEQSSVPAHLYDDNENYCVNDYIYKVMTNSESTADLKNICAALYYYGKAAADYYENMNS